MRAQATLLLPLGLLLLLAACEQSLSLRVASAVPAPVVSRLPVKLGVVYTDELRNYVFAEDSEDRPRWEIDSGASHLALFRQLLASMFAEVAEVAGTDANAGVDAVLLPGVAEMQFSLPAESRTKFYEAWVKYDLVLHDRDGNTIASWSVTGYGKSSRELLKSRDKGLNTAVDRALRDAGAKFALGFRKVAGVGAWLEQSGFSAADAG